MIARICGLLTFVFSFSLLFTVLNTTYSSETTDTLTPNPVVENDFNKIEYNFTLENMGLNSSDSLEKFPDKIARKLDMFTFEVKPKYYKVIFADTVDRKLDKNNYILRVRPRIRYMEGKNKSKITVKSRSKKVEDVRVLMLTNEENGKYEEYGKPKKEIDINGKNRSYSVSNDIEFNYKKFLKEENLLAACIEHVTAFMRKEDDKLYEYIQILIRDSELIIPGVVDRYKFDGTYKNLDKPKFVLEVWAFKKGEKEEYLVSLSFKGKRNDEAKDLKLYKEISEKLRKNKLLSNEQTSKTNEYFKFFTDSK